MCQQTWAKLYDSESGWMTVRKLEINHLICQVPPKYRYVYVDTHFDVHEWASELKTEREKCGMRSVFEMICACLAFIHVHLLDSRTHLSKIQRKLTGKADDFSWVGNISVLSWTHPTNKDGLGHTQCPPPPKKGHRIRIKWKKGS